MTGGGGFISEKKDTMDEYLIDDQRTTLPWLMLSLKSDIMDCKVARCRFAFSKNENLARKTHKHVVYEMHYIIDGEIIYDFPGMGCYHAKKRQFTLIPQGRSHSTRDGAPGVTEYLVIAFLVSSENAAVNRIFSPDNEPMVLDFTEEMESLIEALFIKERGVDFFTSHSTKLIVHSILMEAVDSMAAHLEVEFYPTSPGTQSEARINAIVRIVNNNIYSQKLRGEDVAAQLGITTRQLNRICNQYLGCSINRYITQYRIRGMQTLLKDSSYALSDVAELFGFPDVYAFIKHFFRYTGITPGRYRREIIRANGQIPEEPENVAEAEKQMEAMKPDV